MNSADEQYLALVRRILDTGVRKTDHVLKSVYKHAQKDKKEVRFCKKKRL